MIEARHLMAIDGARLDMPDRENLLHVQFRRFAGCPVCNLHLRSFAVRHEEIVAAGVREIVVFHSSVEQLRKFEGELPFAIIADPRKRLYRDFGVEASIWALLSPRVWLPILRAVALSLRAILRREQSIPPLFPDGGRYGLPADILIDTSGRVCACKYGTHANDQWSVDELLAHVRTACGNRRRAAGIVVHA